MAEEAQDLPFKKGDKIVIRGSENKLWTIVDIKLDKLEVIFYTSYNDTVDDFRENIKTVEEKVFSGEYTIVPFEVMDYFYISKNPSVVYTIIQIGKHVKFVHYNNSGNRVVDFDDIYKVIDWFKQPDHHLVKHIPVKVGDKFIDKRNDFLTFTILEFQEADKVFTGNDVNPKKGYWGQLDKLQELVNSKIVNILDKGNKQMPINLGDTLLIKEKGAILWTISSLPEESSFVVFVANKGGKIIRFRESVDEAIQKFSAGEYIPVWLSKMDYFYFKDNPALIYTIIEDAKEGEFSTSVFIGDNRERNLKTFKKDDILDSLINGWSVSIKHIPLKVGDVFHHRLKKELKYTISKIDKNGDVYVRIGGSGKEQVMGILLNLQQGVNNKDIIVENSQPKKELKTTDRTKFCMVGDFVDFKDFQGLVRDGGKIERFFVKENNVQIVIGGMTHGVKPNDIIRLSKEKEQEDVPCRTLNFLRKTLGIDIWDTCNLYRLIFPEKITEVIYDVFGGGVKSKDDAFYFYNRFYPTKKDIEDIQVVDMAVLKYVFLAIKNNPQYFKEDATLYFLYDKLGSLLKSLLSSNKSIVMVDSLGGSVYISAISEDILFIFRQTGENIQYCQIELNDTERRLLIKTERNYHTQKSFVCSTLGTLVEDLALQESVLVEHDLSVSIGFSDVIMEKMKGFVNLIDAQ
jgi:hypothetical protein